MFLSTTFTFIELVSLGGVSRVLFPPVAGWVVAASSFKSSLCCSQKDIEVSQGHHGLWLSILASYS